MADDLELPTQSTPLSQRVYVKTNWSDDWTYVPGLWASDIAWGVLPKIGAARLQWLAFQGRLPHEAVETYHPFLELNGKFVKIEVDAINDPTPAAPNPEVQTLRWFGFFDREQIVRDDVIRLDGEVKPTGYQGLLATGVEQLLDDTIVLDGWYRQLRTFEVGGDEFQQVAATQTGRAPVFNEGGKPNRAAPKDGDRYLFAEFADGAMYWSTYDIVEYLLTEFPPLQGRGAPLANLALNFQTDLILPTWDRPVLSAHGRSVWDLLCELIHARRGLGGYFSIPDDKDGTWELVTFTHAIDAIVLSDASPNHILVANPAQYNLVVDRGTGEVRDSRPDLEVQVQLGAESVYNRVVAQGAPRRSCFSSYLYKDADQPFIVRDWTDAEEDAYNKGAEDAGDYPASASDRNERNATARGSDKLAHVFSRFTISPKFTGGPGFGISQLDDEGTTIYPEPDNATFPSNWPLGWRLSRVLPLYEGQDYTNETLPTWPYSTESRPDPAPLSPMVFLIEDDKWINADRYGLAGKGKRKWSLGIRCEEHPPRIWIESHNARQHVIAKNHFVARSDADESNDEAEFDYEGNLHVTLCIEEMRRAEAVWPDPIANINNDPVLRVKYIDCGDDYRLDWVAKDTVVGIDPETSEPLVTQVGGYVRDDRPFLMQVARAAYEFYRRPRANCTIQKPGATNAIWLGMLLVQIGRESDPADFKQPLNTVVTEVVLRFPQQAGGGRLRPPIQRWTTSHAELDGMSYLR